MLVNNAGIIQPIEKFCDADPEEWESLINTNITGQMRITHAFYSLLKKAAPARIINISSGSALRPLENWSAYCKSWICDVLFAIWIWNLVKSIFVVLLLLPV